MPDTLTPGGRAAVGHDGWSFVYKGSPECGEGTTDPPPSKEAALAAQDRAIAELRALVVSGVVVPGGAHPWPISEVDRVLAHRPRVAWYDRPRYVYGTVGPDNPQWLCAAGVSGYPFISVSLREPGRVLSLVVWESVNTVLGFLGRPDLFDSTAVIGSILTACRAAGVA